MTEYIKVKDIPFKDLAEEHNTDVKVLVAFASEVFFLPTIDIVHCKDCVHYDPPHINDNGKRIEYSDLSTDLPQEDFCVAEHIVSAKYGVNVGGRCTVDYYNGYSEDKRVYRKETDFCSKGER